MARQVLGLDVGGANLKAAHTAGAARSVPFPLWKAPARLAEALGALASTLPAAEVLAVTMTGELCDCWESKRQGVAAILDAVAAVAGARPVRVWTNEGAFVDLPAARSATLKVASANWLALATLAGRLAPRGCALLLDVGTTTTDIVPLVDGRPAPKGRTDPARLAAEELVYRGWKRTPLCALAGGERAAEFFATTHDVYLVLKAVPEDPADCETPDGRPATRVCANRRLARMLLADLETSTARECLKLAEEINFRLTSQIALAVKKVAEGLPGPVQTVLAGGSGEFLLPMVLCSILAPEGADRWPVISLGDRLGEAASAAACAHAVAVLCQAREG
jgi:probable H4MPT-linked C1 transfer pathway protein